MNVVGGTSNSKAFVEDNGDICLSSSIYPDGFCEMMRVKPVFYHSVSVTKELPHLQITLGVSNLFNTKPPRVSTYPNGEVTTIGQSVFSSQYDLLGRRMFLSLNRTSDRQARTPQLTPVLRPLAFNGRPAANTPPVCFLQECRCQPSG